MDRSLKAFRLKRFIRYELISLVLLALLLVVLFQFVHFVARQAYVTLSSEQITTTEKRVRSFIADYISYARLLSELTWVQQLGDTAPDLAWKSAKEDLKTFAYAKQGLFDQVRILDEKGMERLRIETDEDNDVFLVPPVQLQDKSDRYYFTESRGLKAGQVYVSILDLNEEQDEIEHPFNPVIRFVAPIYGPNKSQSWTLILNMRASHMIETLRLHDRSESGQLLYVNPLGYFVEAPEPDLAWGWQIPERENATLAEWNPTLAEVASERDTDTLFVAGDLFVFSTYHPLGIVEVGQKTMRSIIPAEDRGRGHFILYVNKDLISARAWGEFSAVLFLAGLSLFPLTLLSWTLATRQMHQLEQRRLREEAEVLRATQSLARGIAHEFRQPLASLKLASDLAAHIDAKDEAVNKLLRRIPPNVSRIDSLVSELMHLTKVKELEYPGGTQIIDLHGDDDEKKGNNQQD